MIISVGSGKGGTGKTTVSTNLALSIDDIQFFDFDVEEPNSNLFLKTDIFDSEKVNVMIPEIDKDKCDFCGKCSEFCRYNALAVVKKEVLVFPELCHSCGGCDLVCPKNAITYKMRPIGKIEHGKKEKIDFYQAFLNIGEAQAIPVLKALKKKIDKDKDIIIDAPPGTACPFVETVETSDYCILVTEPTPFGLNDLKIAVETVRLLNVPFGVIINRDGVGDNKVELFCQQERIPILAKIPQSEEIAKMYSDGKPFVKEISNWEHEFKKVFVEIKEEVKKRKKSQ
jgi:MinD superfamily P-loop ATPase